MDLTKSKMPCHTRFNMTNKTQKLKVEMTGFEPATPCSQSTYSTGLNYISNRFVDLEGVEPSSKQVFNMNFIQLFGSKSDYRCS